jgi:alpha-L-fucosidase
VSRNGNLMLNFPLPNNGALDDQELRILAEITDWMNVNGEAIYATRPWKISGLGPSLKKTTDKETNFNEKDRKDLTPDDIRFTTKGNILYIFVMGIPEKQVAIPLNAATNAAVGKITHIELLGHSGALEWMQNSSGVSVHIPDGLRAKYALVFKAHGAI